MLFDIFIQVVLYFLIQLIKGRSIAWPINLDIRNSDQTEGTFSTVICPVLSILWPYYYVILIFKGDFNLRINKWIHWHVECLYVFILHGQSILWIQLCFALFLVQC